MDEGDGGWEELRKEARKVEGDLDVKLSSYNKLGGMLAHGGANPNRIFCFFFWPPSVAPRFLTTSCICLHI
jgi:hypothetical protein